jgi:hypothetical protein
MTIPFGIPLVSELLSTFCYCTSSLSASSLRYLFRPAPRRLVLQWFKALMLTRFSFTYRSYWVIAFLIFSSRSRFCFVTTKNWCLACLRFVAGLKPHTSCIWRCILSIVRSVVSRASLSIERSMGYRISLGTHVASISSDPWLLLGCSTSLSVLS